MIASNDLERSAFLSTPSFWGMHYYMLLGTQERDTHEWMEPLFGVSNEEVNRLYSSSFIAVDDPPWPYIYLPMPNRYGLRIEFGDDGERYSLHHSDLSSPLHLGQSGAAHELPVFRWHEIERIDKILALTAKNALHRKAGLLLLFPAIYLAPEDDRDSIRRSLVSAWEQMGVARDEGIGTLVQRSMDCLSWFVRWRNDPMLGW